LWPCFAGAYDGFGLAGQHAGRGCDPCCGKNLPEMYSITEVTLDEHHAELHEWLWNCTNNNQAINTNSATASYFNSPLSQIHQTFELLSTIYLFIC